MFLYSMQMYVIVIGCVCVCVCVCVCACVRTRVHAWSSCPGEIWSMTNDIRPNTIQEHDDRTSTEFNLVTA
jgi:hypothetical protein